MNLMLPTWAAEWIYQMGLAHRPALRVVRVDEAPLESELMKEAIYVEIRRGHLKWVHFRCPLCSERVQLPMAGKERWRLKVDLLRRPTLSPSVWEQRTCGAHFFVRGGQILWCE
jgi:hypothetical protein